MSEAENKNEQQAGQSLDLTIQDLSAVRSIIDVATQRGAFKAGELAAVGTVYNKLAGFLDAVAKQAEAAQAQAQAPAEGA